MFHYLPSSLLTCIIREWLDLSGICQLDTASSDAEVRQRYLESVHEIGQTMSLSSLSTARTFLGRAYYRLFDHGKPEKSFLLLDWLVSRKINIPDLSLGVNLGIHMQAEQYKQSTKCSMECKTVKNLYIEVENLIDFNMCTLSHIFSIFPAITNLSLSINAVDDSILVEQFLSVLLQVHPTLALSLQCLKISFNSFKDLLRDARTINEDVLKSFLSHYGSVVHYLHAMNIGSALVGTVNELCPNLHHLHCIIGPWNPIIDKPFKMITTLSCSHPISKETVSFFPCLQHYERGPLSPQDNINDFLLLLQHFPCIQSVTLPHLTWMKSESGAAGYPRLQICANGLADEESLEVFRQCTLKIKEVNSLLITPVIDENQVYKVMSILNQVHLTSQIQKVSLSVEDLTDIVGIFHSIISVCRTVKSISLNYGQSRRTQYNMYKANYGTSKRVYFPTLRLDVDYFPNHVRNVEDILDLLPELSKLDVCSFGYECYIMDFLNILKQSKHVQSLQSIYIKDDCFLSISALLLLRSTFPSCHSIILSGISWYKVQVRDEFARKDGEDDYFSQFFFHIKDLSFELEHDIKNLQDVLRMMPQIKEVGIGIEEKDEQNEHILDSLEILCTMLSNYILHIEKLCFTKSTSVSLCSSIIKKFPVVEKFEYSRMWDLYKSYSAMTLLHSLISSLVFINQIDIPGIEWAREGKSPLHGSLADCEVRERDKSKLMILPEVIESRNFDLNDTRKKEEMVAMLFYVFTKIPEVKSLELHCIDGEESIVQLILDQLKNASQLQHIEKLSVYGPTWDDRDDEDEEECADEYYHSYISVPISMLSTCFLSLKEFLYYERHPCYDSLVDIFLSILQGCKQIEIISMPGINWKRVSTDCSTNVARGADSHEPCDYPRRTQSAMIIDSHGLKLDSDQSVDEFKAALSMLSDLQSVCVRVGKSSEHIVAVLDTILRETRKIKAVKRELKSTRFTLQGKK